MTPGEIGVVSAIIGAIVTITVAVSSNIFTFKGKKLDDSAAIRKYFEDALKRRDDEFMHYKQDTDARIKEFEKQVEYWRDKYYAERDVSNELRDQVESLNKQ